MRNGLVFAQLRPIVAAVVCGLWGGVAVAQDGLGAALQECARIADERQRLGCFDQLARDSTGDDGSVADDSATTPAVVPLTDDVGIEQTEQGANAKPEVFEGRVVSCKKSSVSTKTFFYFDNGQIWEQRDYARFHARNCEFNVTLHRDAFGYKMKIEDKQKSIRVARVK